VAQEYLFISADNHLDTHWCPKNLWQDRLPQKFKEIGPKVIEGENGSQWTWEGKLWDKSADGSNSAQFLKPFRDHGVDLPDGALPPADPKILLDHMDQSKVWSSVVFASVRKWNVSDPELLFAVYRAFNDYAMEMNTLDPDRIFILPALPTKYPEECVRELDRMIKAGAKAVEFPPFDVAKPVYDEVWEPVWKMASDAKVPLCIHIGGAADAPLPPYHRGAQIAFLATAPFNLCNTFAQLVFCGAFERNPDLKVLFSECRIGWVPFAVEWCDRQVEERAPDPSAPLSMLPSEYAKRNCAFTFEEDYVGCEMMKLDWCNLGDLAMWGSDYPHPQGTWPDVSIPIDKMFEGVDPAVKQRVVWDHAAEMFRSNGPS